MSLLFRYVRFPPLFSLAWFGPSVPFSVGSPALVPQALGLRFPSTWLLEQRLLPVRLLDKKLYFAPSRCCCVQMARSYQACLTSASVNTTRSLVDVLISAWSKKKSLHNQMLSKQCVSGFTGARVFTRCLIFASNFYPILGASPNFPQL